MFGKLESTAAINTSGIGIGLIICKKIVETFDGHITLEDQDPSKPGTTFSFTIKSKAGSDSKISISNVIPRDSDS